MGLGFNWFKEYKIEKSEYFIDEYCVKLLRGDSTSHSYYNVSLVQDLFINKLNISIPRLPNEEWIDSENYDLELIEPEQMSEYCNMILRGTEVDNIDMRNRIEWFKKLSDEGYYLAYDWE